MSDDDFNWRDADDAIAVAFQEQIAVYRNGEGEIVIRQDGHGFYRDDAWIVVRPENLRKLVEAMLALVEPEAEPAPLALPAPADRTAAERQKRYRQRHRNGTTPVTDTVTACSRNGPPELFGALTPD